MAKKKVLSAAQKRFLDALMESKTASEAIRKANVTMRSAHRWLNEDETFKAALAEAENKVLDAAMRQLLSMQGDAIRALEAVLTDSTARQSDKLRAVELALGHVLRLREAIELESRLSELERKVMEAQDEHG